MSSKYRPDISGLRAIAILPVVVYHAFPEYAPGGFIGVDIFFVISGYLISLIIFKGLLNNNFSFTDFYIHRIRRIFPALILVTASCYLVGWFALLPDEFKQLGKHIATGMGFVQNYALWGEAGYFDTASELKPLVHFWSLAVEEQFYLVFPLLVWLAWKARLNVLTGVFLIFIISLALNLNGVHHDPVRTFFAPYTRFWELMAGSILAYIYFFRAWRPVFTSCIHAGIFNRVFFQEPPAEEARGALLASILSFVGLALIAYSVAFYDQTMLYPGSRALAPVLGAVILILAGPQAWVNRKILANKVLVWIGLISYPLYLWHWPLLSFARITESGTPSNKIRISAVVISFILAAMTYYLIEKPIRYGRPSWYKIPVLCALAAVIGYVGYNTYSRDGLPFRVREVMAKNAMFSDENTPWLKQNQDARCLSIYPKFSDTYCNLAKDADPTIQLIGDSHSLAFYPGMRDVSDSTDNVLYIGAPGCLPLLNVATINDGRIHEVDHTKNHCMSYANPAIEVAGKNRAHTIVIWFRGSLYLENHIKLWSITHPNLKDNYSIIKFGLRETFDHLISKNKRLIFVLDNPELGFDPKSCVDSRPLRLTNNLRKPCAVSRKDFDKRSAEYRELVMSVLKDYPSIKVFDAAAQLCDKKWCWAIKDGKMLYRDGDHLSRDGARLIARKLSILISNKDWP